MTTTATDFSARLADLHLVPLWHLDEEILPPEPTPSAEPSCWRYPDVRRALLDSVAVADGEVERRVLLLVNPGLGGRVATTPTLVAGVQLLLPGEVARAHRHTAAAVRFVIEGRGAHTVTDGTRTRMEPGDLVVTANWAWHDHGSESDEPVLWLDGLDLPLVRSLQVGFFEPYPQPRQPVVDESPSGSGSLPAGLRLPTDPDRLHPPVVRHSWSATHRALVGLADDPSHAGDMVTLDYVNPVTGGPLTPTIGCRAHLLRPGQASRRRRETASAVVHVVRGEGRSWIGDAVVEWSAGDVFVVPGWSPAVHANRSTSEPAFLVAMTDEPALRALGLYRCA